IQVSVETEQPLEVRVAFKRDFQLEWPAGLGGTYISWDGSNHAFSFGEDQRHYAGMIGSPSATEASQEFDTNYDSSGVSSFSLGASQKGKDVKWIAIAGSVSGFNDAVNTYSKLLSHPEDLRIESAAYFAKYLDNTVRIHVPDIEIQEAYDWARVSMIQGFVEN